MYQSIEISELDQLYGENPKLSILDVRETNEYLSGHIPGASSMPLSQLSSLTGELSKDQMYYVVCQSGGRSAMASRALEEAGYQVTNVKGGMSAWEGERD